MKLGFAVAWLMCTAIGCKDPAPAAPISTVNADPIPTPDAKPVVVDVVSIDAAVDSAVGKAAGASCDRLARTNECRAGLVCCNAQGVSSRWGTCDTKTHCVEAARP